MKTGNAIAGMVGCAVVGAAIAGWAISWHHAPRLQQARLMKSQPQPLAALTAPEADLAGAAKAQWPLDLPNPLGEGPDVVMNGKKLFVAMNCAGCHGYDGGGGMGPDLKDPYWIYGGTPAAIFRSIALGHPKGMPAWGRALPAETIWQLTAYVGSLGGGVPPGQAQAALQGDFQGGQSENVAPQSRNQSAGASAADPTEESGEVAGARGSHSDDSPGK
ncbi:MAG: c-type cytochrome [Luteimonas sp.]